MKALALFGITPLVESELDHVASKLADPSVRKYFLYQLQALTVQIAEMTVDSERDESIESFLRRKSNAQGRLAVILELLAIQPADPQPAN